MVGSERPSLPSSEDPSDPSDWADSSDSSMSAGVSSGRAAGASAGCGGLSLFSLSSAVRMRQRVWIFMESNQAFTASSERSVRIFAM